MKIAEGCGNRCTYCAIPLIRGDLASRSPSEIVEEAKQLLDRGIRELVLIAQDLGSYGSDLGGPSALPRLLADLSASPGDFWVRLLYIHPDHFPDGILDVMARRPPIPALFRPALPARLPGILRAMGRRADPEANLALLARSADGCPRAVIRSTFLLGFPGETDEDFEQLLSFQDQARPDWLGCFTYSREEDTPACAMQRQGDEGGGRSGARRRSRSARGRSRRGRWTAHVGKILDVLVEEGSQGEQLSLGRAYLQAPDVDGLVVVRAQRAAGVPPAPSASSAATASTWRDLPVRGEPRGRIERRPTSAR